MAEVHAEPLGNPTGSHPPAQRARRLLEEARDEVAAFLGRDPGRGGLHLGRHRVGQPGRPGHGRRRRWRAARRGGRAVLGGRAPGGARVVPGGGAPGCRRCASCRSTGPACSTSTRWRGRCPRGVGAGGDHGGQQRDRRGRSRWPTSSPPWRRRAPRRRRLHRRRASRSLPRPGRGHGRRRPGRVERAQGGRPGRRGRAGRPPRRGRCAAAPARRRAGARAAQRDPGRGGRRGLGHRPAPRRSRAARRPPSGWPALRDRLADGLLARCPRRTAPCRRASPCSRATSTCASPGIEREELLVALGADGVCVSAGSSCASGALEPSHVLAAMGVPAELARAPLRFSLGSRTTEADVDRALARGAGRGGLAPYRRLSSAVAHCADARAGGHVGRRRLVGGGGPAGRAGPRGGRRHPQAVGRRSRTRAAARWPTSTTPAGWPSSSGIDAPRLQPDRGLRPPRRRALRRATTPRAARPTRASSATGTIKFDRLLAAGGAAGLRPLGHRSPRPGRPATAACTACAAAPTRPRTSPTCSRCSARTQLARGRASRWAS